MNTFYLLFIGLFTLGLVSTGFNASGLFPVQVPVSNAASISQTQVTDLTNATQGSPNFFTFIPQLTIIFVSSIISGLVAVVAIVPLLVQYGVPMWLAIMIQGPIWIVELFGVWSIVSGQKPEI